MIYVVDRLEGHIAVLVDDDGNELELPHGNLPQGAHEGSVIAVPIVAGRADWSASTLDEAERQRREQHARRTLNELRKRDPGGDIQL